MIPFTWRRSVGACACLIFMAIVLSACTAQIAHVPSRNLDDIKIAKPASIMIADIGDDRMDEPGDRIGQGVSYWLPISYYARDRKGGKLPVSYYVAASLRDDLQKIGYVAKLANDNDLRKSLTLEAAMDAAKKEKSNYLVTTRVTDGKTNYWGFLVIPFVEPVWTRIGYDVQLINIDAGTNSAPTHMQHKETEWYFSKITVVDAIFDAGLFGKHWHQSAWGETVVSDALAQTTAKISGEIQSQQQVKGDAGKEAGSNASMK